MVFVKYYTKIDVEENLRKLMTERNHKHNKTLTIDFVVLV